MFKSSIQMCFFYVRCRRHTGEENHADFDAALALMAFASRSARIRCCNADAVLISQSAAFQGFPKTLLNS